MLTYNDELELLSSHYLAYCKEVDVNPKFLSSIFDFANKTKALDSYHDYKKVLYDLIELLGDKQIPVIVTDKSNGEKSRITFGEAVEKLSDYYIHKDIIRQDLKRRVPLQTPFFIYEVEELEGEPNGYN